MNRKPGTVYTPPVAAAGGKGRPGELATGDVIAGHYVVEEMLGDGGMAVVYRATNSATGKQVALKILQAQLGDRPEFVQLFAKEAKVSSVIGDNEHIVQVFDAGLDEDRGIPFIVMELLEGETLEQVLERGPLELDMITSILEQLSIALEHAHQAGVVHRDLKPSNLFLTSTRRGDVRLKVMDFGIAKVLEGEAVRTATQIGTPAYNAPEQMGSSTRKLAAKQGITIAAGVSPATDVWAVGLLAYEMFTGDLPGQYWGVETLAELPMKVAFEDHQTATSRAGSNAGLLPESFDAWFSRCLRKNAGERFQTAGDAIGELLSLVQRADGDAEDGVHRASTRVVYEAPARSERPVDRKGASSPPPLPPVSSPSIVQEEPTSEPSPKVGHSTGSPVVKGATTSSVSPKEKSGSFVFTMVAGIAALVAAGAVGIGMTKSKPAAAGCDEASPDACQTACESGALDSCATLAQMAERGEGVPLDQTRARALYEKACGVEFLPADAPAEQRRSWGVETQKEGCEESACLADACVSLASFYEDGRGGAPEYELAASALYKRVCSVGFDDGKARGVAGCVGLGAQREVAGETVAARNYYSAACHGDDLAGCVALADVLQRGDETGEGRDEKKARSLFQKACDGGDLKGCTLLGRMVEQGRGGWVADEKAAIALYKRACEGGQLLGCVELAGAHREGKGGLTPDAVRSVELLQSSCDGGEQVACAEAARMQLAGEGGLKRDERGAFETNRTACEAGALRGCTQLGQMYSAGMAGLTVDLNEARSLYETACRGGEQHGCVELAKLDATAGKLLGPELQGIYDRACQQGVLAGCVALGELVEQGEGGVQQDLERAADLYGRSCDRGEMRGCTNLANLTYQGVGGLDRDVEKSFALNEKACKGGDAVGCARLGLLHVLGHGTKKDLAKAAELHGKACKSPESEGAQQRCDMLQKMVENDGALPPPEVEAEADETEG